MFKERTTEQLIEYIHNLPQKEQKVIAKAILSPKTKSNRKASSKKTEKDVLNSIKKSLQEIKQSKKSGKPMKTLDQFLDEL